MSETIPTNSARGVRKRRDRHQRGLRRPLLLPHHPAWKSRREKFDDLVISAVQEYVNRFPQCSLIEFCTEEIPPSDPGFWEDSKAFLARAFPATRSLKARIIIYRLPIQLHCHSTAELKRLLNLVLAQQLAQLWGCSVEEIITNQSF